MSDPLPAPLPISRVYCVIDNSRQADQRARLFVVNSGATGKALDANFDASDVDVLRTLVMITELEAVQLSLLFARVEERLSEGQPQ